MCCELLIGEPVSEGGCEFDLPGWLKPVLRLEYVTDLGPAAKHAAREDICICGSGRKALAAHLAEVFDEGLNGLRGFPPILSIALPELKLHIYVIYGGKIATVFRVPAAWRRGARHAAWRRGARHHPERGGPALVASARLLVMTWGHAQTTLRASECARGRHLLAYSLTFSLSHHSPPFSEHCRPQRSSSPRCKLSSVHSHLH